MTLHVSMPSALLSLLGASAVSYFVYNIITHLTAARRFRAFADQHGCKKCYDMTGSGVFAGWARLKRVLDISKTGEDVIDDIICPDFEYSSTIQHTGFDRSVVITTIEPANLQAILATQFKDFDIGIFRCRAVRPLLGDSIFTSDGALWEHSRALFRPQFARENINNLDMTERATRDLIDALGDTNADQWTADLEMMPLLFNFTLDTATDFLFGESIDSQRALMAERTGEALEIDSTRKTTKQVAKDFSSSLNTINSTLIMRLQTGAAYWLSDGFAFRRAIRTVFDFSERFVRLATEKAASETKSTLKRGSLLNNLATQTSDRTELRNQTLAILLAGRDTTASLLGWCFERLALHPEYFDKLRSTILRTFPPEEEITFEKLKHCRYLQHFLNEVLRLHPTVPFNNRVANKDTTLPVGGGPDQNSPVAVFKGQNVSFGVYAVHRRKDLWGDDALEFRPERWEERRVPPWHFLPFLGGPRVCLGQQYALTEAGFVLVRVLQQFDAIQPVDRTEMARMRKGIGVAMWPADLKVRLHKADA